MVSKNSFCVLRASILVAAVVSAFIALTQLRETMPHQRHGHVSAAALLDAPPPKDEIGNTIEPMQGNQRKQRGKRAQCNAAGKRNDLARGLLLAFAGGDPRALLASCRG